LSARCGYGRYSQILDPGCVKAALWSGPYCGRHRDRRLADAKSAMSLADLPRGTREEDEYQQRRRLEETIRSLVVP
jgi:hypothetical protein